LIRSHRRFIAGPDNDRTATEQSPDAHRTPRAFRLCASRCAEGARDGVFAYPAFALRPGSHFFLTFFRWLEANRAEREPGQGRAAFCAFIGAQRRPLTRLPRSVHSSAKKWDHRFPSPLVFSGCGFFLAACFNLAASWCLVS